MDKKIRKIKLSKIIPPHFSEATSSFFKEEYSYYWLAGGRGSCKSTLASLLIPLGIIKNPNSHAICARRFKVDLHNSVYSQIIKSIIMLEMEKYWNISSSTSGAPVITYKETGQQIHFIGLDESDGIKSISPKFGYFKYSWFEELHQLPDISKIRSALQSVRRGSDEKFTTFYTYNPPRSKNNWINQEAEQIKNLKDYYYSISNWEQLPEDLAQKWLGRDWINDALTLKKRDIDSYKHEYLGIPIGYGSVVFKNIEEENISDEKIKKFDNVIGGLDFGFANDEAAFSRIHYDKKNRILYIFDEVYGKQILNRQLAEIVKRKLENNPRELIVADCAEPKSILELKQDFGLNIIPCKKGQGSIETGTKFLQELTHIIIDRRRCPNTFREFTNAEFEIDKYGNTLPKVKDSSNHTIDAIRYALEFEMGNKCGWKK